MRYYDVSKYTVYITDVAAEKMKSYIEIAPMEISGLGTIKKTGDLYLIDDIYLLKQECTPAFTELDQGKIIEFITDQINGGNDDTVNRLRLWWHSHVNMGTFWSGQDRATINAMQADDVWISIVGNKSGGRRVSVDYYNPRICFDDVPLAVMETGQDLSGIKDLCKREVDEKVVFKTWSIPKLYREAGALEEVDEIINGLDNDFSLDNVDSPELNSQVLSDKENIDE